MVIKKSNIIIKKAMFFLIILSVSCNNYKSSKNNTKMQFDLNQCNRKYFNLQKSKDTSSCLTCFKIVVNKYNDSLMPKLTEIDFLYSMGRINEGKLKRKLIQKKYGEETSTLFQNLFLDWTFEKKLNKKSYRKLSDRMNNNQLNRQQEIDFKFFNDIMKKKKNDIPEIFLN